MQFKQLYCCVLFTYILQITVDDISFIKIFKTNQHVFVIQALRLLSSFIILWT